MSQYTDALNDTYALRHELFNVARENAKGLSGAQTLECMEEVGRTMYESGADKALQRVKIANLDNIASAWDNVWLALLIVALKEKKK